MRYSRNSHNVIKQPYSNTFVSKIPVDLIAITNLEMRKLR